MASRAPAARKAGVDAGKSNPHSLRHSFVTAALDVGVSPRDVRDAAGHADPRPTCRYQRARHNLDRAATYAVTVYLASGTGEPRSETKSGN